MIDPPVYDENLARQVDDWAKVPGAPDQLRDVPTHCAFWKQFIPITDSDPVLLIGKPWSDPTRGYVYAAHERCLREHGDQT